MQQIYLYDRATIEAAVERLCRSCRLWHEYTGSRQRGGYIIGFLAGCEAQLRPLTQDGGNCPYFERVTKE